MALTIPPDARPGLTNLYGLPPEVVAAIVEALEHAPLEYDSDDLNDVVAKSLAGVKRRDIETVIDTLWGLEYVRTSLDLPLAEFVEDLEAGLLKADVVSEERVRGFHEMLVRLLQCQALTVPSKARSLLAEGTTYCRARVLTDVRPIFSSTDVDDPKAAVVVHNLVLSFHKGSDVKNVCVTLDSAELERLGDVLDRAKAKQRKLEELIASSGARLLRIRAGSR